MYRCLVLLVAMLLNLNQAMAQIMGQPAGLGNQAGRGIRARTNDVLSVGHGSDDTKRAATTADGWQSLREDEQQVDRTDMKLGRDSDMRTGKNQKAEESMRAAEKAAREARDSAERARSESQASKKKLGGREIEIESVDICKRKDPPPGCQ